MPPLFDQFFDALWTMPLGAVVIWALAENIIIFVVTLTAGHLIVRKYGDFAVAEEPEPITPIELVLAASCVTLNTAVTVVGIMLWREGVIRVDFGVNLFRVLADSIVLFMGMDVLMYFFHRVAHLPLLYPIIHRTHHRFENPRPLTLFVLNPFETLGFGTLWLLLIAIYPSNWMGIIIYLTTNIVFGLVGHVGVEPMPNRWVKVPFVNYISTSTFHAEHHLDKDHNYGFYTLIWDRLFGTISPDYLDDFQAARRGTKRVGSNVN